MLSGKFVHCLQSLSVAQSPENFQCPASIIIHVKRCDGAINSPHQFQIDPKYNKPRDICCHETSNPVAKSCSSKISAGQRSCNANMVFYWMKAQEWIRVLTDSSTFCPVTVHTAKPPHRAFLSYQDIGLYSLGEWGNKNYKKIPRSPMEHDAFKWLAMNCSTDAKTNVSRAVLALLAHLLPSLRIVAGMTWEKSSLS